MAKKSKYADVVKNLPRMDGVEPSRQDALNVTKAEVLTAVNDSDLTASPETVRAAIEQIDGQVKVLIQLHKRMAAAHPCAAELATAYVASRAVRERFDSWGSSMGLIIEAYQQLMLDAMASEGLSAVRLIDGQLVSSWEEPYPQVVDKDAFRRWCMADPDLSLKMQLHFKTVEALCKERLLAGESEPPGIEVKALTKVMLTGR